MEHIETQMKRTFPEVIRYMSSRAPFLIARRAADMVFGIITTAVLARSLSKEQFAIYSLVFSFSAIFRLTTLPGLGNAILQGFARGNSGGFRKMVRYSMLGSLLGSLGFFFAAVYYHFAANEAISDALVVAGVLFPIFAGLLYWRNAAVGNEEYSLLFRFDVIGSGLKFAGILAASYFFPTLLIPVLIAAFLGPSLVNIVASLNQARKTPDNSPGESGQISYGVKTTLYQVPSVLSQQLDQIIVFAYISPEALAIYAMALKIPELIRTVVGETNATLGPYFARKTTFTSDLRQFSLQLSGLYILISILGAIFVVPYLLPLIAGDGYSDSVRYSQFMVVGASLGYLGGIHFRYIKAHLDSSSFLAITIYKSAADLLIILVCNYFWGLPGIVAAYGVRYLGFSVITSFVVSSKSSKGR